MKRTLYATQENSNYVVYNMITGNIIGATIKNPLNVKVEDEKRSQYKEYLKGWLLSEMAV